MNISTIHVQKHINRVFFRNHVVNVNNSNDLISFIFVYAWHCDKVIKRQSHIVTTHLLFIRKTKLEKQITTCGRKLEHAKIVFYYTIHYRVRVEFAYFFKNRELREYNSRV